MSAWSRDHDRCVECGRSDRPHEAKGLCGRCCNARYHRASVDRRSGSSGSRRTHDRQAPFRQPAALERFHLRRLQELGHVW